MQIRGLHPKMRNFVRILLGVSAAAVFAAGFWSRSAAQLQRGRLFQHATPAHKKLNCNSCHKVPTKNSVSLRGFPDVADFPDHPACFSCHRRDVFSPGQVFCAGCHVNPGPRGAARFRFPVATRPTQFTTVFPHNVHQDIIASVSGPRGVAVAHFVNASFSPPDDPVPEFNNCAICHQTEKKLPGFTDRGLLRKVEPLAAAAADDFKPTAEFFKDSPETHASCFTCHYQNQKPIATDCMGCHLLTPPRRETDTIERFSLKFNHQDKDHANKDCATCHVRITQTADLRDMKGADVPIFGCGTSSCHATVLAEEIGKREATAAATQPVFQCTYCHTSQIGRFPVPASHRLR